MVSVGSIMVSVLSGGIPIPGFVFVPHIWYVVRVSVQNGRVLKINSVHFRTLFSSVVQVLKSLGSKLPFQVPFQVHKK